VQRVAVKELGEMSDDPEPPIGANRVRPDVVVAEVAGQGGQPRLSERTGDDLEQRPGRPVGEPWILGGIDARGDGHDIAQQALGEWELHPGADPVPAAGTRAQLPRQPLGQPPLHPAGRDRDDLSRERIGQRGREQPAERLREMVGTLGTVKEEHPPILPSGDVGTGRGGHPSDTVGTAAHGLTQKSHKASCI